MSRFGIRKKIRSLMGGDADRPEIVTCRVTFILPDGTERAVDVEEGYNLAMTADVNGITISTGRRAGGTCPDGLCALCRVDVVDATGLGPMKPFEKKSMDGLHAGEPHEGRPREPGPAPTANSRLACHTRVVGSGGRVQILELFDPESIRGQEDGS